MNTFRIIPIFLYLLIAYNGVAVIGADSPEQVLNAALVHIPLISGARFVLTGGELFIILGVVAIYLEILKSTANTVATVIDHMASLLVFVAFLVEFIVVSGAGTSVFFILMLMSLLDVAAGFTVTLSSARRDISVNGSSGF